METKRVGKPDGAALVVTRMHQHAGGLAMKAARLLLKSLLSRKKNLERVKAAGG